jgi:hypothetical protein
VIIATLMVALAVAVLATILVVVAPTMAADTSGNDDGGSGAAPDTSGKGDDAATVMQLTPLDASLVSDSAKAAISPPKMPGEPRSAETPQPPGPRRVLGTADEPLQRGSR